MRLGRASAYGILAIFSIADRNGSTPSATAPQIAATTGVPIGYLRKILQRLSRARIIRSERGRGGGFALRRSIDRITLLQVVEAIEGPIDEIAILDDALLDTTSTAIHSNLRRWRHQAARRLRALLRQTSLDEILYHQRSTAAR